MSSFMEMMTGMNDDDKPKSHGLSAEAQIANLTVAWDNYREPKRLSPGEIVRCQQGMSIFKQNPTILLYVRPLDPSNTEDRLTIEDEIGRSRWNHVNCIVMRVHDSGTCHFLPFDDGILERVT